jgi:hypothetical protein
MDIKITPRTTDHGIEIGPTTTSFGRSVILVNPEERDTYPSYYNKQQRFILWFGAYGSTHLMIWADYLEDALEVAIDWIVDHAPGLLADDAVEDEYKRLTAEHGCSSDEWCEECGTEAKVDTTGFGHNGMHYLNSWEWGIALENPTRDELIGFLDPHGFERKAGSL